MLQLKNIMIKKNIQKKLGISFSKSAEDLQISKLLKDTINGIYVDVGCWHPKRFSNSYYFYLRNWKTYAIDPNPELQILFKKYRSGDIFINEGISIKSDELNYYMLPANLSSMNSFDLSFLEKHNLDSKISLVKKVRTRPLNEILNDFAIKSIDVLDIDVEGMDFEILKSIDLNKYQPKLILFESDVYLNDYINTEIDSYLQNFGYFLIAKTCQTMQEGNLFYMKK